jgi:hypothetical protein
VVTTVLEELRRLEEPTPEEFVDAVIRTHERIQSKLRALARDADSSYIRPSSAIKSQIAL